MEQAEQKRKARQEERKNFLMPFLSFLFFMSFFSFLIPCPSSLISHPSSLFLPTSSLIPSTSSLVPSSFAFNSEEWLGKRELLAREAERLRAAYSNCVARLETPAENVTVPVETFDDGSVKVVIFAEKAQYFLDSGLVWAAGVAVKKFKKDGTLDGRIDASNCVVDRFSKSGWAEGPATVVHGKTTFKGRGVYFSSPESYVKVVEESEIDSKDLKFGGMRP